MKWEYMRLTVNTEVDILHAPYNISYTTFTLHGLQGERKVKSDSLVQLLNLLGQSDWEVLVIEPWGTYIREALEEKGPGGTEPRLLHIPYHEQNVWLKRPINPTP